MQREDVEKAIEDIKPQLMSHGGSVELVDIQDKIVKVKLTGACSGCPMSQMTLRNGVEAYLKKKIPEIEKVEAVK